MVVEYTHGSIGFFEVDGWSGTVDAAAKDSDRVLRLNVHAKKTDYVISLSANIHTGRTIHTRPTTPKR